MRHILISSIAMLLYLTTSHVAAAPYDGSKPLLCAPLRLLECRSVGTCEQVTAESANIPQFVKVDVQQKTISAANDSTRQTAIHHVERINGNLILQGFQGERGWSFVLATDTGKLSLTVSEDDIGFVIFGACTPL